MKSLFTWLRRYNFQAPIVICIAIATAYLLPFLIFPGFSVIDDGWNLQIAHTLTKTPVLNWTNILVETAIGRLRPIYYLYFYLLYVLAGARPWLYWVAQWFVLAGTLILAYKILYQATKNKFLSLAGLLLPFIFPTLPENLYRLGTQEPKQLFLQLLFIWWAMKLDAKNLSIRNAILGSLVLIMALGMKETSLILIPLFLVIYVLKFIQGTARSLAFLSLALFLTLLGVGFYFLIPEATSYSLGYQITPSTVILRAFQIRLEYVYLFLPLVIAACFTAVRLYFFSPSLKLTTLIKDQVWQAVILAAAIAATIIILPWNLQLSRYYYNITWFILMYIIIEVAQWWALGPKIKKTSDVQKLVVGMTLVGLVLGAHHVIFQGVKPRVRHMFWETGTSMSQWFSGYQNNYILIKYLMEHTRDNESFYAAFGDYEVTYDMGQYASLFGERPIKVYNFNQQMSSDFGEPYIYIEDPYAAYAADPGPKILVDKSDNSKLDAVQPPVTDLVPYFTFYKRPIDVWGVSQAN